MTAWPTNYASSATPPAYRCGSCGASGVKLWREYDTFLDHQTLECIDCAGKSQNEDVSLADADGKIPWDWARGQAEPQWIDQIGFRVPAVPTEEGDTFWGYSSVPREGVAWWRSLPTRQPSPNRSKES